MPVSQPKPRTNKWLEGRVEFLEREIAKRNAHIVYLLGVQMELDAKRHAAVRRGHKLQLEVNRLKRWGGSSEPT